MKLICEVVDNLNCIYETNEKGGKNVFIEGVFMQGNLKNRNGRIYATEILDRECNRYNEDHIVPKRALGELGHPQGPTINLERVSHMITKLERKDNDFVGRAKIMDTPYGNIVKNLLNEGAGIGVSTRGMGSIKDVGGVIQVQPDFHLATIDIVADPSAPNAFVESVMEGKDWVFDEKTHGWRMVEQLAQVKRMSKAEREQNAVKLFESFIKNLSKKF